MSSLSSVDLLVRHAVRLKGFADTDVVAARFGLDVDITGEALLDDQARGWVTRSTFAGLAGWSLSEAGRRHNQADLRDELDLAGARNDVRAVHEAFLPLNGHAVRVFTAWQLARGTGPVDIGPVDVYAELHDLARGLDGPERMLTARLARFAGYHHRFQVALERAVDDPGWITGTGIDSCHSVWFELHEDLTATLGVAR